MQVCKFANVLKSKVVKKGDRVAIYMPMVNELVVAMLACARIGAVHSIVFGGYRDQLYKKGFPGKSILEDYFQENRTSRRPFQKRLFS